MHFSAMAFKGKFLATLLEPSISLIFIELHIIAKLESYGTTVIKATTILSVCRVVSPEFTLKTGLEWA